MTSNEIVVVESEWPVERKRKGETRARMTATTVAVGGGDTRGEIATNLLSRTTACDSRTTQKFEMMLFLLF